jgi:hypothetical protein
MADSGLFYGFAYDQNFSAELPMQNVSAKLTIEGNPVEGFEARPVGYSAKLPSGKTVAGCTILELVKEYVTGTGVLECVGRNRREHLETLREGKDFWNQWRLEHPQIRPLLPCVVATDDFLPGQSLAHYDFSHTNFGGADLRGVHFEHANFHQAILAKANLSGAHLEDANFCRTDLYETNFTGAYLDRANLQGVQLAKTNLTRANLVDCTVYGLSSWDLELEGAIQKNLTIRYRPVLTEPHEEVVRVNDLDLAAFMHFTRDNQNIARVINAASAKWVLLLGRFSTGKDVLESLRQELAKKEYIPIIFDFDRPERRDLIETVILLAGMSRFVIVDITNPQSTPLELQAIAANFGVPVFPIIKKGQEPFGMFSGLRKFRWVFRPLRYNTLSDLIRRLHAEIIEPAEAEAQRLTDWKNASGKQEPS